MKIMLRLEVDEATHQALVDEWLSGNGSVVVSVGEIAEIARITYVKEL